MITKELTGCCALCQLRMFNGVTVKEVNRFVNRLKAEAETGDEKPAYGHGQRAAFVITTPEEFQIEEVLKECGFKPVFNFKRRNGYPGGTLTQWNIAW